MAKPLHHRPLTPQALKSWLDQQLEAGGRSAIIASQMHRGVCVSWLDALFVADDRKGKTAKRHALLEYLTGSHTSKYMTVDQANALLAWAVHRDPTKESRSRIDRVSAVEAARVIREIKVVVDG